MWIFTTYGFYSAVCDRKPNGSPDAANILVRSRNRRHLENLKKKFSLGCPIRENEGTDYACRMSVPKAVWAQILSDLVMEQDYRNFKDEASRKVRQTSNSYVSALHEVWGVMLNTQVTAHAS